MNLGGMFGGLTKNLTTLLPLDKLDSGIATLRAVGQNDLADKLAGVRSDLANGTLDPKTSGPMLTGLGGQIEGAAGNLNDENAAKLQGLGGMLRGAGGMMGG